MGFGLFLFGLTFGFLTGYALRVSRERPQTLIFERDHEGATHLVPGQPIGPTEAYAGPPLRPYVVREDGATEYTDGEVVWPDRVVIQPPDMFVTLRPPEPE